MPNTPYKDRIPISKLEMGKTYLKGLLHYLSVFKSTHFFMRCGKNVLNGTNVKVGKMF